jgi:hypothetical protein
MIYRHTLTALIISALSFGNAFALVDYTESEETKKVQAPQQNTTVAPANSTKQNSRSAFYSRRMIELKAGYSSDDVKTAEGTDATMARLNLNLRVDTPWDIYFDVSYWQANTDDLSITESTSSQAGNAKALIGFNWLRFGQVSNEARVDIIGGVNAKGSSDIAHTSNDIVAAIETSKRFLPFALSIGYEMRLRGTPKDDLQMSTGNISRLKAGLGWMAAHNIHFGVEASTYTINQSKKDHALKLDEKLSFSTISPVMRLGLGTNFVFEMGAAFRTKKAKETADQLSLRFYDLPGFYGTSLFAGLAVTI